MADASPNSNSVFGAFDLSRIIALVRRRALIFVAITLAVTAGVTMYASRATPRFEATARVAIDPKQRDMTGSDIAGGGQLDNTGIDTEVQILASRGIALAVVEQEGLASDPEFGGSGPPNNGAHALGVTPKLTPRPAPTSQADLDAIDLAADILMGSINVRRAGSTYIINVSATSLYPEKAARLANAYVAAYIGNQVNVRNTQVTDSSKVLSERAAQLRTEAEEAVAEVQRYKMLNNLIGVQGSTSAEQEVSVLNQQIAGAQAELSEKEARLASARAQLRRGDGGDIGAVVSSDTIRGLRAQEAVATANVAQLAQRYGERMQPLVDARSQLEVLQSQIKTEIARIMSNLESEVRISQQRLDSLRQSLGLSRRSLVSNNAAMAGLAQLQSRADIAQATYAAFQARADQASAQEGAALANIKVVQPARPSWRPSSPNTKLATSLGLVVGVMVAMVVVAILELMVRGVQSGNEIERKLGVPYAGGIPLFRSTVKGAEAYNRPQNYLVEKPFSAFAEAMRSLWSFTLRQREDSKPPKVVAIVSALSGEGKSFTAFCLTRTMAMNGSKVVLVDCDVRRRGASALAPKGEFGLLDVLNGKATLDQALVKDDLTDAWFLPSLGAPEITQGQFMGEPIDQIIAELSARFDYVVLDTAPVLALAETRDLAVKADAVLFLGRWSRTPAKAMALALDLLIDSGANLIGVALTQIDLRKQGQYAFGDQYDYFKEYKKYYTG